MRKKARISLQLFYKNNKKHIDKLVKFCLSIYNWWPRIVMRLLQMIYAIYQLILRFVRQQFLHLKIHSSFYGKICLFTTKQCTKIFNFSFVKQFKQIDHFSFLKRVVKTVKQRLKIKRLPNSRKVFIWFATFTVLFFIFKHLYTPALGAWWNNSWHYRKAVTVNYTGTTELNDFQIKVSGSTLSQTTLYTDGKLQADCSDIRFTDSTGKKLSYWIEETSSTDDLVDCSANNYDVWVKVPKLQTGDNVIYFYYGNKEAQSESNGGNTFDFFDEFGGDSLDTGKWSATDQYSVSNGELSVTTGSVYTNNKVGNNPQDHTFELKAKWSGADASYSGLEIADAQSTASSNASSNKLAYNMTNSSSGTALRSYGADGTTASYNIVSGGMFYNQTLGTRYIIGYDFDGSANMDYFVKNTTYGSLATDNRAGTWSGSYYLWLGYYSGSVAGTNDIDDISADWVRVRKYASISPGTPSAGSEQTQENYSSSGGKPVAYWPLTSDTCDNNGCINVGHSSDNGKPPVLQMGFDEGRISNNQCPDGSVADICDVSGNGNNGIANGGMTDSDFVGGKVGKYALDFDGSDDYVEIKDSAVLKPTSAITVSAWIATNNSTTDREVYVDKRWSSSVDPYNSYLIDRTDTGNNTYFEWCISNGTSGSQTCVDDDVLPNTGQYYFLTGTYDGVELKLYKDGVLVNSVAKTGNIGYSNLPLYIGSAGRNDTQAYGLIDDVKIYDYARTPEQIKQDYNNTKAYFGGGSSNPTFESINATAPGDPHIGSTRQYLNFDGVDDFVGPLSHSLINGSAGSVSLWMRPNGSQSPPAYVFSLPDGGNNNRIYISYAGGGYEVGCRLADGTTIGTYTTTDSQLYNLICTWNGTSAAFYVNGEDKTTVTSFPGFTTTIVDFYLGSLFGTSQYFKGQMAGVKIFDYALGADEVKGIYNAGIDGTGTSKSVKIGGN